MDRIQPSEILKNPNSLIEISVWLGMIGLSVVALFLPLKQYDRFLLFVIILAASLYTFIVVRLFQLLPYHKNQIIYIGMVGAIFFIAIASYLLDAYEIHLEIFYLSLIAVVGILTNDRFANHSLLLALSSVVITAIWRDPLTSMNIGRIVIQLMALAIPGFMITHLSGVIHQQVSTSDQQNQDLSFLLKAAHIAYASDDLERALSGVAQVISRHFKVRACRICLYDLSTNRLQVVGAYPPPKEAGNPSGPIFHNELTCDFGEFWHTERILTRLELEDLLQRQGRDDLFWHNCKSLYLLPLKTKDSEVGLLAIADGRDWNIAPFGEQRLDLIRTLASQISVIIQNIHLSITNRDQANINAMLNDVAKAIGSTIELESLLDLIYEQLSKVLPSDTYFVSLYDESESSLDIRILIDEGTRFQPEKIPLGQGLASLVIASQKPLLIRHLTQEIDTLPVRPIIMGNDRISESWLGVPLIHGSDVIGLLAIASYQPYAFQQEDIHLLSSLAVQAALAIDNANHHAEVEEQANRDSLTQAYNHGFLLRRLAQTIDRSHLNLELVSIIMLDIDHFKAYNDRYGHLVGDDVLIQFVKEIKSHIKKADIVGRWGGEEFAILLPGASHEQAYQVAERIRSSLAAIHLFDLNGEPIPPPTASQGIATYPTHAIAAAGLVDVADKALYIAKHHGRDQIQIWNPEDSELIND